MLAAAVDDPLVLERLRRQARSRGAAAFDFERIRLFAGLAAKVRQNDIRLRLPLTFTLLDRLKVSIAVFADYAKPAAALRQANKKSRADKIDSFCRFLDGWLDHGNPDHALAWDLVRHERALFELRDGATALPVQPGDAKREKVTAKSVPVWRARIRRCFDRYSELANAVLGQLPLPMPKLDLRSLREVAYAPRRPVAPSPR